MSKTVRIEGLDEVVSALHNAGNVVNTEGRRFLDDLGAWTVKQAQAHTTQAGAIDLGELVSGIYYKTTVTPSGMETVVRPSDKADEYAIFVERGTKPHFPPIAALQGWADRHGIPAFLVARKIARDGTEPRYMWRDTLNDLQQKVDSEANRFAVRLVGKL